jgi:hypothetical protein
MSERPDAGEGLDNGPETEVEDQSDVETVEEDGEGEAEDGEEPRKKTEDWEKRAHNAAGQAAREKSRRRAAERRAEELSTRVERLERTGGGDQDQLLELIGQLSDDEEDPIGDIARVKQALRVFRARQLQDLADDNQYRTVSRQIETLRSAMHESEEDFTQDHPDYLDAAAHYRKERVAELKDAGYSGAYLDRKLADDLFGVVRMAIESGQDPAERVYALAQKRGFKAGAKQANGKLDKLQAAADAGARATPGQRVNGALTWGDVAKLDGAARDKAWAKLRERETARGGRGG